jgi:hypothetical protein
MAFLVVFEAAVRPVRQAIPVRTLDIPHAHYENLTTYLEDAGLPRETPVEVQTSRFHHYFAQYPGDGMESRWLYEYEYEYDFTCSSES